MAVFKQLLANSYFIGGVMSVVIFAVTQLIKMPIKAITKKYSKTEENRNIANIIILFIPFALGLIFEFLYYTCYLHTTFTGLRGLSLGASAVTVYGIVERFLAKLKVKVNNPYTETEEGKAVTELVEEISEDGKINSEDIDTVQKFLDKIKDK